MSPSLSTHLCLTLDGLTWPIPLNLKEINHKCVNGVPILMLSVFICLFVSAVLPVTSPEAGFSLC